MKKVKVNIHFLGNKAELSLIKYPFGKCAAEQKSLMEKYHETESFRHYYMFASVCAEIIRRRQYTGSTMFTALAAWKSFDKLSGELKAVFQEHGAALERLFVHLDVNVKAVDLINAAHRYAKTHNPGISLEFYAVDFFDAVDGYSVSGMRGKEAAEGVKSLVLKKLRGVEESMQAYQDRLFRKGKPVPPGDRTVRQTLRMVLDWAEGAQPSPGDIMDEVLSDVNSVEACHCTALPGKVGYLHLMMRRLHGQIVENLAAGDHIPSAVCMLGLFRDLLDACREVTVHSYLDRYRNDLSAIEDLVGKDDTLKEVYMSVMKNG